MVVGNGGVDEIAVTGPTLVMEVKYGVEDGKLVRKAEFCPTCGPGVFLAVHEDRKSCGRCGYTVKNE